jgi:hypothetical protein
MVLGYFLSVNHTINDIEGQQGDFRVGGASRKTNSSSYSTRNDSSQSENGKCQEPSFSRSSISDSVFRVASDQMAPSREVREQKKKKQRRSTAI